LFYRSAPPSGPRKTARESLPAGKTPATPRDIQAHRKTPAPVGAGVAQIGARFVVRPTGPGPGSGCQQSSGCPAAPSRCCPGRNGARHTEEKERSLSEIIESFNERHGMQFSRADFLRFERVTREIMDEDMTEMIRNNPADMVFGAFPRAFFQGMVKLFQHDNEMRNIVMTDKDTRDRATRHFFRRAQRQART